jgi:PKD repeat protein
MQKFLKHAQYATLIGVLSISLTSCFLFGKKKEDSEMPCELPVAKIENVATEVTVGQNITFTNASKGTFTNVDWRLPSGNPAHSSESVVTATYGSPGSYTVTLIVTNECGVDSKSIIINVKAAAEETEYIEHASVQLDIGKENKEKGCAFGITLLKDERPIMDVIDWGQYEDWRNQTVNIDGPTISNLRINAKGSYKFHIYNSKGGDKCKVNFHVTVKIHTNKTGIAPHHIIHKHPLDWVSGPAQDLTGTL